MPIPSPEKKAEPQLTARERIYNTLRDWIIDGTLAPDEKVSDTEIAAYFSVSRTPVREALQRLADQKLIEIFPGKESRVAGLNLAQVRQTYIMLAELQGLAVRFAYDKISGQTLRELAQINRQLADAWQQNDRKAVQRYDQAFHARFLELAGNEFLTNFSNTLYIHALRTENLYYALTATGKSSADEHEAILAALQNHDPERAVAEMRANWTHTADLLEHAAAQQDAP